ncbi:MULTISPECIES: type II secretion system protein GspJ [unclassified Acinetobacter]|uniref:type II secretion system protein GspJ n=1 Tax=unclassified Acinetobacter TaxID=196816 RepID=UPI002934E915|nr:MULTISPECIES: type II secretion system protein GspJ [unclassified Acinetobacter]WOE32065.1 type II secretion system protein GspJ [Acinetobacter sp. SAAs470]WOE37534.1 type II secretion system protein GspJ [Acinetobacter sp. SAAs474]
MNKTAAGFTLVELLVAIAIFAILAAMGWQVFEHISYVKARNTLREKNLIQLQQTYQIFLKDSIQIAPIVANQSSELQPALLLQDQKIALTKAGVTDPLAQAKPVFERIEYRYQPEHKHVVRSRYAYLNIMGEQAIQSSIVLKNIDAFKVTVLNPNEMDTWPDGAVTSLNQTRLPSGIKVVFTQNGIGYEWVFAVMNASSGRNN